MASLKGKFEATAVEVKRLLNLGKAGRPLAKALLLKTLAEGGAGPLTQKLAAEFFSAGRGRQPTGLYRWIDIGEANRELVGAGTNYADRLEQLSARFGRGHDHIEKCIAEYEEGRRAGDAEQP